MRDVARAAAVSVATVSNVLNHPRLVAPNTRERIRHVIRRMDFQPDLNARALRHRNPTKSHTPPPSETAPPTDAFEANEVVTTSPELPQPALEDIGSAPGSPRRGEHVNLQVGPEFLSGVVDAVMPDLSCFWVWADGGMGRRMVHRSEVTVLDNDQEPGADH